MKANNTIVTRVKCYGDNEMITKANELKDTGYTRVANAYWVEHWQKDNALLILERCNESERPTTPEPDNTPATMNANETTANKTMYTDYYTAVNWCNNHRVMCNNIAEIDPSVYDNARFAWYDEETEADTEVFQWFITDCSEDDVNFLESHFPGLLFTYSELLDCFVLCVDHFGTMWKGVAIETTLEYAVEKSQLGK